VAHTLPPGWTQRCELLFYSQADHTRTFVLRQGGAETVRRLALLAGAYLESIRGRLARLGACDWTVLGRGPAVGGGLHAHPGSCGGAGGEVVGVI
jgi:hypothetical protein